MATEDQPRPVAKERFFTAGNVILLVVAIAGVVCLAIFAVRARNYCRRTKSVEASAETKPIENKPGPTKAPIPELPKDPSPPELPIKVDESKTVAEARPDDPKRTPSTDDPFVTESRMKETCESYFKKAKRFVSDKIREVKQFVVKCQNEPPPVKTADMRGRRQNSVCAFQFERAVLYQISHKRCTPHNACTASFVWLEGGYSNPRSLYEYWNKHKVEVESAKTALATIAADRNISIEKYFHAHYDERKGEFKEIKS